MQRHPLRPALPNNSLKPTRLAGEKVVVPGLPSGRRESGRGRETPSGLARGR